MGVQGGVFAFEFDGLLWRWRASDGSAKDVALAIPIDVAFGLLHLDELRLALKVVEQEDAGIFGQAQSGSDLRKVRLVGFAVGVAFLVDEGGFGDGGGGGGLSRTFRWPANPPARKEVLPIRRARRCCSARGRL